MPPLYNPVHLAQSAALIDVLSRGRLILGVGVGYHPRYFDHFGVPIKQREGRFEESLEIIEKAWTTVGPFAHHGKYYNFSRDSFDAKALSKASATNLDWRLRAKVDSPRGTAGRCLDDGAVLRSYR